MYVKNHAKTEEASEEPVYKVIFEDQAAIHKVRLSVKSEDRALFNKYPLGQPFTISIKKSGQRTLEQTPPPPE